MGRGILQVLGQHRAQGLPRAQTAIFRHEGLGFAPTQRLLIIVRHQNANLLLLSYHRRRGRRRGYRLLRNHLLLAPQPHHVDAAQQNAREQQSEGDLEVPGNHKRAPIWPRALASPAAMAEARVLSVFWLSPAREPPARGVHSTAMAGATRLFNGRRGVARVDTVIPVFLRSAATAMATALLRPSAGACALSQRRNRPEDAGAEGSSGMYTRTPLPGGPA